MFGAECTLNQGLQAALLGLPRTQGHLPLCRHLSSRHVQIWYSRFLDEALVLDLDGWIWAVGVWVFHGSVHVGEHQPHIFSWNQTIVIKIIAIKDRVNLYVIKAYILKTMAIRSLQRPINTMSIPSTNSSKWIPSAFLLFGDDDNTENRRTATLVMLSPGWLHLGSRPLLMGIVGRQSITIMNSEQILTTTPL